MELSNIIYRSKEMDLCECGGTDLQSQHSGVSAKGGVVWGQNQPRLYNKKKKRNLGKWSNELRHAYENETLWLCDYSHEELQKHWDIHWKCDLVSGSIVAAGAHSSR